MARGKEGEGGEKGEGGKKEEKERKGEAEEWEEYEMEEGGRVFKHGCHALGEGSYQTVPLLNLETKH